MSSFDNLGKIEMEQTSLDDDLFDTSLKDVTRNYMIQAPVELPRQKHLTVKLVPLDLLEKIMESKNDYDQYLSLLFAVLGLSLGFLINLISDESKIKWGSSMMLIIVLLIIIIAFSLTRVIILKKRYNHTKTKIFNAYTEPDTSRETMV